ncbi:MAG TPA: tetratricopeptide repeat protein [Gammaproteobacteria bacterium]
MMAFAASDRGGFGGYSSMDNSGPMRSPEKIAADAYNNGVEIRDEAIEYEQAAVVEIDARKKEKLLKKAQKAYAKAGEKFEKAVRNNPEMYQGWSAFGHALRKTGDYERSLEAYKNALALNPKYYEAVEYQAEAHMHLGQYEKVKTAYAKLMQAAPDYAAQLIAEIHKWLPTQDINSNPELKAFAAWAAQEKSPAI